jgi:hypothetical protein
MTKIEAEAVLTKYRWLLKAWTLAMSGFSDGDSDAIGMKLTELESDLAAIAVKFPKLANSVEVLVNARKGQ